MFLIIKQHQQYSFNVEKQEQKPIMLVIYLRYFAHEYNSIEGYKTILHLGVWIIYLEP